ncbi:MAG: CDP-alcohol phosphatidyltransferase family protein [Vicinamibacterales bacterium]
MPTRPWRLPEGPLRRSVLAAGTGGLVLTWFIAQGLATALFHGVPRPMLSVAIFGAMGAWAAGAAGAGHPFARFGPANTVTTARLVLVALTGGLIGSPLPPAAAWVTVAVAVTVALLDGVDGWLARRSGLASPFGARFDMETDALFILVLSALVWTTDKAGAWVLAAGLMRYAFVAARIVLPWMAGPLTPTLRGKTVAVVQFVGLAAALALAVTRPWSAGIAATALLTLTWSFAVDVGRLRAADGRRWRRGRR